MTASNRYIQNPRIIATHSVNFFYRYNQETSRIRLSNSQSIDCHIDGYQISMTNANLRKLVHEFDNKSKELMIYYRLVNSSYKANDIMDRLGQGNCNPDTFIEFEKYIEGSGNTVKSFFELYLHPLSITTSLLSGIALGIGNFLDDKKHIKNINKLVNFTTSDTLMEKQAIYRYHLKDFLLTFAALKRVLNTGRCCTFRYDSSGISHIEPL